MFEFLKKSELFKSLFGRERSGATARERLRLVLLTDRLALAPDVIDALKADLLTTIARYVEIDPAHAEVNFQQREREIAMLASVPILAVRRDRPSPPQPRTAGRPNGRSTGTAQPRRRRRKRAHGATPSSVPMDGISPNDGAPPVLPTENTQA